MKPEVRYCTTSDGVRIAYEIIGRGPPIVWVSLLWGSHLSASWRVPQFRSMIEALAADFTVVRHDGRGSGLSQREPLDFLLEARLRDLDAVIERTQAGSFALLGQMSGGQTAIAYAARHPDRVSALVLVDAFASGSRFLQESPAARFFVALQEVTEEQWDSVTLAMSSRLQGTADAGAAEQFAELLRASMTPDGLLKLRDATRNTDVTPLLKDVATPTLVVHQEGPLITLSLSQELASGIPNARIVVTEAPTDPARDNPGVRAIKAFLGVVPQDAPPDAPAPAASAPSGLQTILFTDVEGSTALTERLGDAKARDVLRGHERIVREALKSHGGSEVKTMGDGFMASFASAARALECAMAIQRAFADWNTSGDNDVPLQVRVGVNAGEPVAEDNDLFGTVVNMAARIAGQAAGGEIFAANVVRELVAGKRFLFSDRGESTLRGFEDPVRLWELRWQDGP